jgi:hypothetical protein
LGQNRGGREDQTGGILQYFEDLSRAPNKEFGPKNFFEIASNLIQGSIGQAYGVFGKKRSSFSLTCFYSSLEVFNKRPSAITRSHLRREAIAKIEFWFLPARHRRVNLRRI